MTFLHRRANRLHLEEVPLARLAETYGTPLYVYSAGALTAAYRDLEGALAAVPHRICYAVKANPNLAVLRHFARLGAGFDIVSGGELARVLAAGADPGRVVFSGVGKSRTEMRAALEAGIHCFNIESEAELARLDAVAGDLGRIAPVSLRVNPDVDAKTHPYISTGLKQNKFGIPIEEAPRLYRLAAGLAHVRIVGLDCHIGSQLTELAPMADAADRVLALADRLAEEGMPLAHIDLGGGLGIRYRDETPPDAAAYGALLAGRMRGRRETLLVEPGRYLVGNAGVLLTRVEYLKRGAERSFLIVDAAMNDLMRPALYDAWHAIEVVDPQPERAAVLCDVVGPVCETADFLGRERLLAAAEGDVLAILSAGAYGMSMSSTYNSRPRAAEVMVTGNEIHLIRERDSIASLMAGERLPA